jgi:hypothetical protein
MLHRFNIRPALVIGIASLTIVMRTPRFANFEHVDVVELIAAGLMFGLALRALAMWIHDRFNASRNG